EGRCVAADFVARDEAPGGPEPCALSEGSTSGEADATTAAGVGAVASVAGMGGLGTAGRTRTRRIGKGLMDSLASAFVSAAFGAAGAASAAATSTLSEFGTSTCAAVEAPSGLGSWAALHVAMLPPMIAPNRTETIATRSSRRRYGVGQKYPNSGCTWYAEGMAPPVTVAAPRAP